MIDTWSLSVLHYTSENLQLMLHKPNKNLIFELLGETVVLENVYTPMEGVLVFIPHL